MLHLTEFVVENKQPFDFLVTFRLEMGILGVKATPKKRKEFFTMARRGDNIRKRKDGRWEGRYKKGRKFDGTIIYGSVYGKSYLEVKERLSAVSIEQKETAKKGNACVTFGEILERWMINNRIRLKGGTINKYQNIIDTHILPELGSVRISDVSADMINQFLTRKLQNGKVNGSGRLSPSYIKSIMLIITSAHKYAVSEELCSPLKSPINKPSIDKKDISIFSMEEQKRLECTLTKSLDCFGAGILISLYTGLRIGEVCALSWNDVDLKSNVIHIRHTVARIKNEDSNIEQKTRLIIDTPKTRASIRDIPISSKLMPVILFLKDNAVSNYVISQTNSFVSPRTFEYHYHRILEEGNIAPINFHCVRHTFATRCIEAGVDVKSLSEIPGHANVGITLNTYVHSSLELKRNQLEKLSALSA